MHNNITIQKALVIVLRRILITAYALVNACSAANVIWIPKKSHQRTNPKKIEHQYKQNWYLIRKQTEKSSGQFFDLIVMSH
jgi:hypothetical protein